MPLPGILAGAIMSGAGKKILTGAASAFLGGGSGAMGLVGGEDKPKRHRRKTLTKGMIADVTFLSNNISKKAAENYLLRQGW